MTRFENPEHDEILLSATVDFDSGCGQRAKRAREMRRLFRCVSTDCPRMCEKWNLYLGLVGFWDDVMGGNWGYPNKGTLSLTLR